MAHYCRERWRRPFPVFADIYGLVQGRPWIGAARRSLSAQAGMALADETLRRAYVLCACAPCDLRYGSSFSTSIRSFLGGWRPPPTSSAPGSLRFRISTGSCSTILPSGHSMTILRRRVLSAASVSRFVAGAAFGLRCRPMLTAHSCLCHGGGRDRDHCDAPDVSAHYPSRPIPSWLCRRVVPMIELLTTRRRGSLRTLVVLEMCLHRQYRLHRHCLPALAKWPQSAGAARPVPSRSVSASCCATISGSSRARTRSRPRIDFSWRDIIRAPEAPPAAKGPARSLRSEGEKTPRAPQKRIRRRHRHIAMLTSYSRRDSVITPSASRSRE